jgi:hypothetical protein
LAVGTIPQVELRGTRYVLQADVDAFIEACQCQNQRATYAQKQAKAVAA